VHFALCLAGYYHDGFCDSLPFTLGVVENVARGNQTILGKVTAFEAGAKTNPINDAGHFNSKLLVVKSLGTLIQVRRSGVELSAVSPSEVPDVSGGRGQLHFEQHQFPHGAHLAQRVLRA